MKSRRRFPPPWSVEEQKECFVAKDEPGKGSRQLAGVSRVETVFRAHVGNNREVLAASD